MERTCDQGQQDKPLMKTVAGFLTRRRVVSEGLSGVRNHGLPVSGEAMTFFTPPAPLTAAWSHVTKLEALTFLEMGQQIRAAPGQPGAVLAGLCWGTGQGAKLVVARGRQTEGGRLCWPRRAVATWDSESRQVALTDTVLGQPEAWTTLTRPGDRWCTPEGLSVGTETSLGLECEAGPLALGRPSGRRHFPRTGRRQPSRRTWAQEANHEACLPTQLLRKGLYALLGLRAAGWSDSLISRGRTRTPRSAEAKGLAPGHTAVSRGASTESQALCRGRILSTIALDCSDGQKQGTA